MVALCFVETTKLTYFNSRAVSKAHFLFTSLGLRHLIVLGGESGGQVVGIITRINLLRESIADRSGYEIDYD